MSTGWRIRVTGFTIPIGGQMCWPTAGHSSANQVTQRKREGTVLYRFTGGNDGRNPWAGVVFDQSGNLYGATSNGGSAGAGVVYELMPSHGGWTDRPG